MRGTEPRQVNIRPSIVSRIAICFAIALTFALALCPRLLAVAPDDHNPIGMTGVFEGIIATGCAYNVLNHNARREIDDIVVPGAIGKYGLKMTRYYNSRNSKYSLGGLGASWTHEYMWGVDTIHDYKVTYPNGNTWDKECFGDLTPPAPLGVSDGWQTITTSGDDFRLADGGTVHFDSSNGYLQPRTITDPYGQTTTLTYDTSGTLIKVTEPGGRYLQFNYLPVNGYSMLHEVDAYDGQGHLIDYVVYNYTSVDPGGQNAQPVNCLTSVTYRDGQIATYTYTTDNQPDHPSEPCPCPVKILPVLKTCQDFRYKGPMRQICYDYQDKGQHGEITAERYLSGSTTGPQVSSIDPPVPSPFSLSPTFPTTFTETRGDGPVRTFNYTALHLHRALDETCPAWTYGPAPQQFLQSYTDFSTPAHTTFLGYDGNWYVNSVTDANGHITDYLRGPPPNALTGARGIGQILKITHHEDGTHIDYTYESEPSPSPGVQGIQGHYVHSITDERGTSIGDLAHTITYTRDTKFRVTRIDYPTDANTPVSYEEFTYNGFGQVLTHHLRNGAWESFVYDGRGLLTDKYNPKFDQQSAPGGSDPHTHYDYYLANDPIGGNDWIDRVKTVTLPANASGKTAADTYEYDKNTGGTHVPGRGLITKITHNDSPPTYKSFGYDAYGNKLWEENELREHTSYTYDDYNRLLTVKDPIGQTTGHQTSYRYNPTNGSNTDPRLQTTNNPDLVTTAAGIATTNDYDENFRKTSGTVAGLTTWFGYDYVGNQTYVTDPRGSSIPGAYTTYTDYDNRNRKSQVRAPLSYTTQFFYEDGINVTRIVRAFGTQESNTENKTYDGMNRVLSDAVQKSAPSVYLTTWFTYSLSGRISKITDARGSGPGDPNYTTSLYYDASDRKTKMSYPGGSNQQWTYDNVGNLASRSTVNPANPREIQSFGYDIRNRKTSMSWNNNADWANFVYWDDSRLKTATNANSTVYREYDDDGHLTLDQQTVAGLSSPQSVKYEYDDDGKPTRLYVLWVSGYDFTYSYDTAGRFEKILLTPSTPLFQYYYDPASNETERDNILNSVNQTCPRDALNRMLYMSVMNGGTTLAKETYSYDGMNRITGVTYYTGGGPADSFHYYLDGELNTATVGNPSHTLTYTLDNKGNRTSVQDTAHPPPTTYSPNTIDQYTSVTGNTISNGPEHEIQTFNTVTYNYINDERLSSATTGSSTYSMWYDALGRCVKRTLTGAPATYYVYDGEKPILEYDVVRYPGTVVASNLYGKGMDEILERTAVDANGYSWVSFPQENHEGSVTLLTDLYGTAVERYRYDAFGAPTIYDGSWNSRSNTIWDNRFLFTGREYASTYRFAYTNAAFNFYEYRARGYNPTLGRFMSEDPKLYDAGDYNLFRYCHNDPIDSTDPMGTDDQSYAQTGAPISGNHAAQATQLGKQMAHLQALQKALGWPGHGAIQMGQVNYAIAQTGVQLRASYAQINRDKLSQLGSVFRPMASRLVGSANEMLNPEGYEVKVADQGGYRTFAEQAKLRAISDAGGPHANKPGESAHNYGAAIDIDIIKGSRAITRDTAPRTYDSLSGRLGALGEHQGLIWGGRFNDPPHFQHPGIPVNGPEMLRLHQEMLRTTGAGLDALMGVP